MVKYYFILAGTELYMKYASLTLLIPFITPILYYWMLLKICLRLCNKIDFFYFPKLHFREFSRTLQQLMSKRKSRNGFMLLGIQHIDIFVTKVCVKQRNMSLMFPCFVWKQYCRMFISCNVGFHTPSICKWFYNKTLTLIHTHIPKNHHWNILYY